VLVGGLQLPSVNTGTFAVSDAATARLAWDDTLGNVMISADGGAYQPQTHVFASAVIDLTTASAANLIVPAKAGMVFQLVTVRFLTKTTGGALTATPTTVLKSGGVTFGSSSSFPAATIFAPGCVTTGIGSSVSTAAALQPGQAFTIDVSVPATGTGAFAWTGIYHAIGFYVPLP
jgi:hypothetical protein